MADQQEKSKSNFWQDIFKTVLTSVLSAVIGGLATAFFVKATIDQKLSLQMKSNEVKAVSTVEATTRAIPQLRTALDSLNTHLDTRLAVEEPGQPLRHYTGFMKVGEYKAYTDWAWVEQAINDYKQSTSSVYIYNLDPTLRTQIVEIGAKLEFIEIVKKMGEEHKLADDSTMFMDTNGERKEVTYKEFEHTVFGDAISAIGKTIAYMDEYGNP